MPIPRSQPFTARVQHDGVDTTAYRLYVEGVLAEEKPISAFGNGVVDFFFPTGLPVAKAYQITATAVNQDGESTPVSATLVVLPKVPNAPVTLTFLQ